MKILEVGCGGGAITRLLLEHFQLSSPITGIDFDEKAIQIAKSSNRIKSSNVEFQHFDITQSDLGSLGKDYDFIYCRFLLSHLKNLAEVLGNLNSILKPKGIIVLEDTYFDGHFSIPQNSSFDRYVELFKKSALKRGAHPILALNFRLY